MNSIGRNDPCSCGSGKKYKRCCLDKVKATKRVLKPCPCHSGQWFDDELGQQRIKEYESKLNSDLPLFTPFAIQGPICL